MISHESRFSNSAFGNGLRHDFLAAVRKLVRKPRFAISFASVLGVSIAGPVALFVIVDQVILKPPPFPNADRLYELEKVVSPPGRDYPFTLGDFEQIRQEAGEFELVGASHIQDMALTGIADSIEVQAEMLSATVFSMLGASAQSGRLFSSFDEYKSGIHTVVLSQRLWERHFASNSNVIGRVIRLDDVPYMIIGVASANFRGPRMLEETDLWLPLAQGLVDRTKSLGEIYALAKKGVGVPAFRAQLNALSIRLQWSPSWNAGLYPSPSIVHISAQAIAKALNGRIRQDIPIFTVAIFSLLVAGCSNTSEWLLIHMVSRAKEWGIRLSVGCGRLRLIQRSVLEIMLLSLSGGFLGVILAAALVKWMITINPTLFHMSKSIHVGPISMLFALVVSVLVCLSIGTLPALRVSSSDASMLLRGSVYHTSRSNRSTKIHRIFVLSQIAAALTLLAFSGLLIGNFVRLGPSQSGFRSSGKLAISIELNSTRYDTLARKREYLEECVARLKTIPGVSRIAATTILPLSGLTAMEQFNRTDTPYSRLGTGRVIHVRAVTTNYFTVMGIPRREGRAFSSRDTSGSVPVAVVNMAAARRFWPDRNPIGTTVSLDMGSGAQLWHIVGIVADVRSIALSERFWPEIFVPLLQAPSGRLNILLESSMPSQALITATRHVLQSVDPAQPAREIERLETMINRKFDFARFRIWLVSTFAILVIVITVAGIGGLMAEIGQQRSHEVAIRIALGANRRNVFALVIKDMVAPLAGGILIGSFTSWCLSRWAAEVAFGFPNLRLEPLCLIIALFVVIISPAVVFPALQLSRIKPVDMLRYS